ncbi:MAG: hypothetical protein KC588_14875 [Nitrospira sp.]|nr:hypothetical protein [Nitrospira sp.]
MTHETILFCLNKKKPDTMAPLAKLPKNTNDSGAAVAAMFLQASDIPELSRFLANGFNLPVDCELFSPDVLRWKYLDCRGTALSSRSLIVRKNGNIIGHVGLCTTSFIIPGEPPQQIDSVHLIDLLASRDYPTVGLFLMKHAFRKISTQYAIGMSAEARKIARILGYRVICNVPIFCNIIRPLYRLKAEPSTLRKYLGVGKDLVSVLWSCSRPPQVNLRLCRVDVFGGEIEGIIRACKREWIYTERSKELLNYFLRYPKGNVTGWLLHEGTIPVGFAILSISVEGRIRKAKIVDCFLNSGDPEKWHSAVEALLQELKGRSVDLITSYATAPEMLQALKNNGFYQRDSTPFYLRDPSQLIPTNLSFYFMPLEADHAYL